MPLAREDVVDAKEYKNFYGSFQALSRDTHVCITHCLGISIPLRIPTVR